VNYAYHLLAQGRIQEISGVFAGKSTLQELCPERKEFHITEAVAFSAFMGLYRYVLGYQRASDAWLELASEIDDESSEIAKAKAIIQGRNKKLPLPQIVHRHDAEQEYFPPSMLLVLVTPEQKLIDFLTPLLPIPCTIEPRTAEHLKRQGILLHPTQQVMITSLLDMGYEGGVVCMIESPSLAKDEKDLATSITHLIIKPKHKAAIRVQEYQRKRVAQLQRDHGGKFPKRPNIR
jgi:hypothetical protein